MDEHSSLRRCPRCGAKLPVDAQQGLCPACLVAIAEVSTIASPGDTSTPTPVANSWRHVAQMHPTAGSPFGPYHIVRLIGRGGMGDVYEAYHTEQGRRVALKVLNQHLSGREDRARFLREGQLAASINHPHTVYIFGSEEIEGSPTINMELLPGGTLKDRVKTHGPLPPAEAVDAVLQVIDGLNAMHAVGVLHRDVKPSNCFIDGDGTVKVGDFGLSISTLARDASQLTITGAFLGTPQYAAPEQLKGDPLDVRADIYGVGATLYYLLTGQPPFDDSHVLALVTRIASEEPQSPRVHVPSIPRRLAAIVLRCLARDRTQRPASYAVLRDALQPFSSAAAVPAPLRLRFVAGAIDIAILRLPFFLLIPFLVFQNAFPLSMIRFAMSAAYYGILEGIWGVSVGKRLLGLRVVMRGGGHPPGLIRAIARVPIVELPSFVAATITSILRPDVWPLRGETQQLLAITDATLFVGLLALLFATARHRNGSAAIHDLLTGTRVIHPVTRFQRHALDSVPEPSATLTTRRRRMGPFDVIDTLGRTDRGTLLLGFDPRLRRRVWLHELPADAPSVSSRIRDLSRSGRLRWLGGRRTLQQSWDAYEALDGAPLVTVNTPQPWRVVRQWLADLAREIDAALGDGTLGRLTVARVWITREGRAKLLDFLPPDALTASVSTTPASEVSAQVFLSEVATSALTARTGSSNRNGPLPRHALPISASALLDDLARGDIEPQSALVERTTASLRGADRIERRQRVATLALCAAIPAAWALLVGTMSMLTYIRQGPLNETEELSSALSVLTLSSDGAFDRAAAETYIAGRFGPTMRELQNWSDPLTVGHLARHRQLIDRILANHPRVSSDDLAASIATLDPFFEQQAAMHRWMPWISALAIAVYVFVMVSLVGLMAAWIFRGGFLLRTLGIAVVTRDGQLVSRLRALWRALVAWAIVIVPVALVLALSYLGVDWTMPVAAVASTTFAVGAIWAIVHPERGLQDRIAGTYLVPR